MRVVLDGMPLLLRSAGVKTYLHYWGSALRAQAGNDTVAWFPFIGDYGACRLDRSVLPALPTALRLGVFALANHTPLPVASALAGRADIFHAAQVRQPPRGAKLTATFHDLTSWIVPETHRAHNVAGDRMLAERIWTRADALLTVSENSKSDAVRFLGIDPRRIHVVYPGVAPEYFDASPAPAARPYVLFVSTIEPRKNLDTLLDAWEQLPAGVRGEYDLVVAGPQGWRSETTMARLRAGAARYLGFVPESNMPGLFAGAAAFVYPSLYEGFGIPVVQAMAAGAPVIAANVASLPEVAGGAALYVDPRSPADLTAALLRLLTGPSLRAELVQKGKERARGFQWEAAAARSWQIFRSL